jgi:hypothetical protein
MTARSKKNPALLREGVGSHSSSPLIENGCGDQMRSKSQTAWETAARCAALAQETDDPQEREHYTRLRDAWITLAKRCEPFHFPDVTAAR